AALAVRTRTCPAPTWSPTLTASSVTTGLRVKLSRRVCTMVTVPAADAVITTVPRVTGAVVAATVAGGRPPRRARPAVTAMANTANTTTATTTSVGPRRRNVMVR